jgi:hypothetical protein
MKLDASRLLESLLLLNHRRAVIREIEWYFSSPQHPDPYPHRHPEQRRQHGWYFHRQGPSFRGGTYKGVDFTVGGSEEVECNSFLIRCLELDSGELIEGPSRCVDYILQELECTTVAELSEKVNRVDAFDEQNPLRLVPRDKPLDEPILATARVGLSLKRAEQHAEMPRFFGSLYRFITLPDRLSKGRLQTILALHQLGCSETEIRQRSGATLRRIRSAIQEFEQGKEETDFSPWFGRALSAADYARVLGLWWRRFGTETPNEGSASSLSFLISPK